MLKLTLRGGIDMLEQNEIVKACLDNNFKNLRSYLNTGLNLRHKDLSNIPTSLLSLEKSKAKTAFDLLKNDEFSPLGSKLNEENDEHPDAVSVAYFLKERRNSTSYEQSKAIITECLELIIQYETYQNTLTNFSTQKNPQEYYTISTQPTTNSSKSEAKLLSTLSLTPKTSDEKQLLIDTQKKQDKLSEENSKKDPESSCCTLF